MFTSRKKIHFYYVYKLQNTFLLSLQATKYIFTMLTSYKIHFYYVDKLQNTFLLCQNTFLLC